MRLLTLLLLSLLAHALQAQDSFNYLKWKAEQEAKNRPAKERSAYDGPLIAPSYFVLEPSVQVSPFRGPALALGGSYKHVHLEADLVYGLAESYQIKRHIGHSTHAYTYHPYSFGLRAGYDFVYRGCFAITPEVGFRQVNYYGKRANEVAESASETATAQAFTSGVRLSYAFSRSVALTVVPEYDVVIGKGEVYKILVNSDGGDDIRRWVENVNVRIGLSIMF